MDGENIKGIGVRAIEIMADGSPEDFEELVHPEFLNHEAKDEPPASRGRGPMAAYATALLSPQSDAQAMWWLMPAAVGSAALLVRGRLERSPEGVLNLVADRLQRLALTVAVKSRDFR